MSRRLIDKLKNLEGNNGIRLGSEFHKDIDWWNQFSASFNGISKVVLSGVDHEVWFYTDASFSGYGIHYGGDWQAGFFNWLEVPCWVSRIGKHCSHSHWLNFDLCEFPMREININLLELIHVLLALIRLSQKLANRHLVCFTDNMQVKSFINKGVSSNSSCMSLLRKIFWVSVEMNCYVTARYIPGDENSCADMLSRLTVDTPSNVFSRFDLCCSGIAENR